MKKKGPVNKTLATYKQTKEKQAKRQRTKGPTVWGHIAEGLRESLPYRPRER